MIIYSQAIVHFIQYVKTTLKKIIQQEVCLKVFGDRFYDKDQHYSYPIKIVIYEHRDMLGYFNSEFYELGFHERLMHANKDQLHSIIRHELAHYLTFIKYGEHAPHHGELFRELCRGLGWGPEVYAATIQLGNEHEAVDQEIKAVLRKVQKLMALSKSNNPNEAEQAVLKSQQLLLKHNIDQQFAIQDNQRVVLKRILKQNKENAKMRSIGRILETFFVHTVYARSEEFIYLEILGTAVNVEIAEYVANVLEQELENLWLSAKRVASLKGITAKNSFFLGVAKGYLEKVNFLRRSSDSTTLQALMVIEKQLVDAKSMVYSHLSYSKSSGRYCPASSALGEAMGRQLQINPGIDRSTISFLSC